MKLLVICLNVLKIGFPSTLENPKNSNHPCLLVGIVKVGSVATSPPTKLVPDKATNTLLFNPPINSVAATAG